MFQHIINGLESAAGYRIQQLLHDSRNRSERDPPFQKRPHGNLIGGIQGARIGAAGLQRLVGQPQARKPPDIRLRKLQHLQLLPVKPMRVRCNPLRIG